MENQPLIQLAKRSATNPTFMASLIKQQANREQVRWEQMAELLDISDEQLAKLALCKLPRDDYFRQDLRHISGYSGVNRVVLMHFMDCIQKEARMSRRSKPSATPSQTSRPTRRANFFMSTKQGLAFSLAALLILILGAFVLAQPGRTEATLVVSAGEAVVNQAGGALFASMTEGSVASGEVMTVSEGDTIRLTENGSAQLRLQDGSTVDLSGGSTATVAELVTDGDSFRFQLNLISGKALSRVVRLLRANDAFEIRTPSSTASVRGTIFTVEVQSEDSSHISVEEGLVQVALQDGASVDVPAGFQVTAVTGEALQTRPNSEPATPTPADDNSEPEDDSTPPEQDDSPESQADKVVICHYPSGDITKGNTLEISADDLDDHLAHGDTEGACPDAPDGEEDDPDDSSDSQTDKVVICHYPGGDTTKGNTLEISADALDAHLAHGDTEEACSDAPDGEEDDPDDSSESQTDKVIICHYPGGDTTKGNTLEISADDLDDHLAHGDLEEACPDLPAGESESAEDSPGNSGNAPGQNDDGSPGNSGNNNGNGGNNGNSGNGGSKP
ncbi:FecR family protein [Candidatus Leptofilum sp.]|uniref:FecR family protein n=1 Tax=Candidatus Leptofilum sp. TaxID=3241576 RepID=UPI003B599411